MDTNEELVLNTKKMTTEKCVHQFSTLILMYVFILFQMHSFSVSKGIPATLTYIDMAQTISGSPQLIPYPDWRSNAVGDCANGLNTVYRIKADKCGRLWVLGK